MVLKENRPIESIQLHVYCDASELAYGCVAHMIENSNLQHESVNVRPSSILDKVEKNH